LNHVTKKPSGIVRTNSINEKPNGAGHASTKSTAAGTNENPGDGSENDENAAPNLRSTPGDFSNETGERGAKPESNLILEKE
jgi:hypothetical protein